MKAPIFSVLLQEFRHLWTVFLNSHQVCHHRGLSYEEGKSYCPQCGCGVIFRWVVLRCQGCHIRRSSQYCLNSLVPSQPCCHQCGERAFRHEYIEQPEFYLLDKAMLIVQNEEEYWQSNPDVFKKTPQPKVWFEKTSPSVSKIKFQHPSKPKSSEKNGKPHYPQLIAAIAV